MKKELEIFAGPFWILQPPAVCCVCKTEKTLLDVRLIFDTSPAVKEES